MKFLLVFHGAPLTFSNFGVVAGLGYSCDSAETKHPKHPSSRINYS